MRLIESRRLTGPNLYAAAPGALAEVAFDAGEDPARLIAAWRAQVAALCAHLGWPADVIHTRSYAGGASLFFAAPIDLLLAATEVNEHAIAVVAGGSVDATAADQVPVPLVDIEAQIAREARPGLAPLVAAAHARGVPALIDDDVVTLGAGARLIAFSAADPLPAPADVPWATLGAVPVALITGTNGKTTTTRLVARIARHAGLRAGTASSGGVVVGDVLVEPGDWSGPDAARLVLRHPATEIAILETARGGILRRGLAVEGCDAALITNISVDHLGTYGIDDLATMARVKAVVTRGARALVLNADDPVLAALPAAMALTAPITWFSVTGAAHATWRIEDGWIVHAGARLIEVTTVPITFGGRAAYNSENALAAAALAATLGLPDAAIVAGLRDFTSSAADNPGRGNLFDRGGVHVLVDFGHNPAAVRGVLALAHALTSPAGGRVVVVLGLPGDRPDDEITEVAHAVAAAAPHQVHLRELADYLRGRAPGDVPALLASALASAGFPVTHLHHATSELAAVQTALTDAQPGDLVLVLAHVDADLDAFLAP